MSTNIGDVNINLRMSLAQFKSDVSAGKAAATADIGDMAGKIGASSNEAKASLALIGEEIGVNIPRHIRGFIAEIPGVGTALNAAFNAVAVLALIEVIIKVIEKVKEVRAAMDAAAEASQGVSDSTVRLKADGSAAIDALKASFIGLTQGPIAEMEYKLNHVHEQLQALNLGKDLEQDFKAAGESLKTNILEFGGGGGLKDFEQFKKDLQSILQTQGRPAALQAVGDELTRVKQKLDDLNATQQAAGDKVTLFTLNAITSYQRYGGVLEKLQARIDESVSQSAEKQKNDTQALENAKVKAAEEAEKKIIEARNKEVEQLQQLTATSKGLTDQNQTDIDKQISKIQDVITKWEQYKVTVEAAHGSISAVANQNIETLTKEIVNLKTEADLAIKTALDAAQAQNTVLKSVLSAPTSQATYTGSQAALDLLKIQTDYNAALAEGRKVIAANQTSEQQYANAVNVLNALLQQGTIDQETYNRAITEAANKYDTTRIALKDFGTSIGDTIKQAAIFGASWSQAFESIAIELAQLILKLTLFKSLQGTSSTGGGGFFTSLLSGIAGIKGDGGPVYQGSTYVVGDRGPELFTPGTSGRITPNGQWGGGSSKDGGMSVTNNEFHFHGVTDADSFRKSRSQIAADMAAALSLASRRNG
jgi:hypothetical protein